MINFFKTNNVELCINIDKDEFLMVVFSPTFSGLNKVVDIKIQVIQIWDKGFLISSHKLYNKVIYLNL